MDISVSYLYKVLTEIVQQASGKAVSEESVKQFFQTKLQASSVDIDSVFNQFINNFIGKTADIDNSDAATVKEINKAIKAVENGTLSGTKQAEQTIELLQNLKTSLQISKNSPETLIKNIEVKDFVSNIEEIEREFLDINTKNALTEKDKAAAIQLYKVAVDASAANIEDIPDIYDKMKYAEKEFIASLEKLEIRRDASDIYIGNVKAPTIAGQYPEIFAHADIETASAPIVGSSAPQGSGAPVSAGSTASSPSDNGLKNIYNPMPPELGIGSVKSAVNDKYSAIQAKTVDADSSQLVNGVVSLVVQEPAVETKNSPIISNATVETKNASAVQEPAVETKNSPIISNATVETKNASDIKKDAQIIQHEPSVIDSEFTAASNIPSDAGKTVEINRKIASDIEHDVSFTNKEEIIQTNAKFSETKKNIVAKKVTVSYSVSEEKEKKLLQNIVLAKAIPFYLRSQLKQKSLSGILSSGGMLVPPFLTSPSSAISIVASALSSTLTGTASTILSAFDNLINSSTSAIAKKIVSTTKSALSAAYNISLASKYVESYLANADDKSLASLTLLNYALASMSVPFSGFNIPVKLSNTLLKASGMGESSYYNEHKYCGYVVPYYPSTYYQNVEDFNARLELLKIPIQFPFKVGEIGKTNQYQPVTSQNRDSQVLVYSGGSNMQIQIELDYMAFNGDSGIAGSSLSGFQAIVKDKTKKIFAYDYSSIYQTVLSDIYAIYYRFLNMMAPYVERSGDSFRYMIPPLVYFKYDKNFGFLTENLYITDTAMKPYKFAITGCSFKFDDKQYDKNLNISTAFKVTLSLTKVEETFTSYAFNLKNIIDYSGVYPSVFQNAGSIPTTGFSLDIAAEKSLIMKYIG